MVVWFRSGEHAAEKYLPACSSKHSISLRILRSRHDDCLLRFKLFWSDNCYWHWTTLAARLINTFMWHAWHADQKPPHQECLKNASWKFSPYGWNYWHSSSLWPEWRVVLETLLAPLSDWLNGTVHIMFLWRDLPLNTAICSLAYCLDLTLFGNVKTNSCAHTRSMLHLWATVSIFGQRFPSSLQSCYAVRWKFELALLELVSFCTRFHSLCFGEL